MKLLVSGACTVCGEPTLTWVKAEETVQDREFQVLIIKKLSVCKKRERKMMIRMVAK